MSTDPSTNPSDVAGDVTGGGHGTNRAGGLPAAAATGTSGSASSGSVANPGAVANGSATPGSGRRRRRGRRRRGGGSAAPHRTDPADADMDDGSRGGPARGGSSEHTSGPEPGGSRTPRTTTDPSSPAAARRRPSPADLVRPRLIPDDERTGTGTGTDTAPGDPPMNPAVTSHDADITAPGPVDSDQVCRDPGSNDDHDDGDDGNGDDAEPGETSVAGARTRVTGPKPSDMAVLAAKITKTGMSHGTRGAKAARTRRRATRTDRPADGLRTVRETSAGGLVISDLDLPMDELSAALIGRVDRRGRMMWSLPKGHIETGETAEQTAVREVAEETGIHGTVVAPLGKIDYWFVSEGRRIHKTVHHYLLRSVGGELSDADYEVSEVAWVPLRELPRKLTYSDERRLARMARGVIADLAADPQRLARSEAESSRTEPNAYERAAAARNQRRNDTPRRKEATQRAESPPPSRSRRRRRRPRRPSGDA